jgi:general nucleoside transport system permease protein
MLRPLAGFASAVVVGLLSCMALALLLGVSPVELPATIWNGAWGSWDSASTSIGKVTPLLLTGLAVSLAYQANLLNIGCEGQLTLGALTAASFSIAAPPLPRLLLLPMSLAVGALVGGMWAYPAIWLRQRRGVHEVVSTLLMNYVAIYLSNNLVLGPLGDGSAMGRTPPIPASAILPPISLLGSTGLTAAPFFALLLSMVAQIWLSKTFWGYEVMAGGNNFTAAKNAGISVDRWQRRIFVLSGALAGLAGALEIAAVHHRFYSAFSPGYGFDGITAAFLVNGVPGWLCLSALLLAGLRAADKWLQLELGVSPNAILIIQAVMLLAVACQTRSRSLLASLTASWSALRRLATKNRPPPPAVD